MLDKRKPFVFKKVSDDRMLAHASGQKGSYFLPKYKVLRRKNDVDYRIRFMPPTWEDPDYFGYKISVHTNMGADKDKIICLKCNNETCPACEEVDALDKAGEVEAVKALRAKSYYVFWVIQRTAEALGPQLFVMDWMTEQDFAPLGIDDETKEILCPYNPKGGEDGGRDFSFKCSGQYKKIGGMRYATRGTPLSDDPKQYRAWLEYIQDNPIPNTFKFVSPDYISRLLGGTAGADTDSRETEIEEMPQTRSRATAPVRQKLKVKKPDDLDLDFSGDSTDADIPF